MLLSVPDEKCFPSISAVIDASSYSSYHRLLNVTVYVLRFINNLKARIKKDIDNIMSGRITVEEIKAVETLWLFDTQKRFRSLESFKKVEQSLGVYVDDDGLLRCRGKLGNAPVPEESKFPILLPRDSYVTDLIVRNCHQQVLHSGVNDTLNEIRSRFWITRGRQFVKKILHKCVVCRKVLGPSYKLPAPPHLPSFRMCGGPALDNVGTDYAGPLYIKDPSDTARSIKAYIVIFACCTSRNIRLELVQSMKAETVLMCLRRYVSHRGIPLLIVSDNAQNFKTSKNILKEIFDSEKVRSYLLQKKIDWDFLQAKSSWWGGFYECLIQVVKRVLRKLLRNARLSYEELLAVLTESECTINSRPLTHMTSDEFDGVPLTPSHLLYGRRIQSLPDAQPKTREFITRRMRYVAVLLGHFWKRFNKEYLLSLREFHNLAIKECSFDVISKGTVVSVQEDNQPRGSWKLGKIEEVHTGNDGKVRGCKVKVITNTGKPSFINRPINHLYPLEVVESDSSSNIEHFDVKPKENVTVRPIRNAALNTDLIRRLRDEEDDS